MKRIVITIVIIAAVGLGIWYAFGGEKKTAEFGGSVGTDIVQIGDITANPDAFLNKEVTIQGELTKECPSSGCWWYIKDSTGEIRADSFGAGFNLPPNQAGKQFLTTGKVVKTEDGTLEIAATGAKAK
ncbi:MAG: hypothetical protein BWY76_00054 [bacterium ADurb.Bin429]|nr:MAG: hypothetical protein BWY76_00054 [bacterium ADurb.Bin429]